MKKFRSRHAIVGLVAGAALLAGACSSTETTSATGSNMGTSAPTTMASGSAATFGSACASVPTTGSGSFEGMAKDPAATAASNNPELSTLVTAVKAAGLVDTLNGPGPFTIFAPANSAFAKIDKATLDSVLADPKGDLTKILTLHVVAGQKLDGDAAAKAGSLKSVNGEELKITKTGDKMTVNGANVVCGNVQTANATVFIIDTVMMPM